jgi:HK97 gp10 family phage protein
VSRGKYVTGQDDIRRRLKALPAAMMAEIDAALDKGAEEIKAAASVIVPRDTGELAGAIEVRASLDGVKLRGVNTKFVRGKAGDVQRFVGVFATKRGGPGWYAAWVEFGTQRRTATPFLRPAYWAKRKRVQARVNRAVRKAAKEAAKL